MKPLGDKIIVKPIEKQEKKTAAGLILVNKQDALSVAIVVEASTDIETKLKSGDAVLYPANAGTKFTDRGGEEFLILREEDCWATL